MFVPRPFQLRPHNSDFLVIIRNRLLFKVGDSPVGGGYGRTLPGGGVPPGSFGLAHILPALFFHPISSTPLSPSYLPACPFCPIFFAKFSGPCNPAAAWLGASGAGPRGGSSTSTAWTSTTAASARPCAAPGQSAPALPCTPLKRR